MNRALTTVRYASGATGVNFEKWLTWAAIGGLAYLGYKAFKGAEGAVDAVGKTVADAYVAATAGPKIEVLARVVLPNGQRVPINDLILKSDATFTYQNVRYRMTKRRPDNDYDAVKV